MIVYITGMKKDPRYTVRHLSRFSGVTVRTLHHYDAIGLLVPARSPDSRYRRYTTDDLLRLQQILFYRELGFPLQRIKEVLDDPDFNIVEALKEHRATIRREQERLGHLLTTIERTIQHQQEGTAMTDEREMYEGFTPEESHALRTEAMERWGADRVRSSELRVRSLSSAQWKEFKANMTVMEERLAALMDRPPEDAAVQSVVAEHHEMIGFFYKVTEEIYRGLAELYVSDQRFTEHYDRHRAGLAAFLRSAMLIYCDRGMKAA